MTAAFKMIDSPVGGLKLVASEKGLSAIFWAQDDPRRVRLGEPVPDADHPVLRETERQLDEYFSGNRTAFDLPLDFLGSEFQRRIWNTLVAIPFGETKTYGQIAIETGNPQAARAVGLATGKNPIAIVVPCHRVIGTSGALTGFAGGVAAKVKLLGIEGLEYDANATFKSRALGSRRSRTQPVMKPAVQGQLWTEGVQ